MRKDFYEIAELAWNYGIFTAVATNATLIIKEIAKKLKEIGIDMFK